MLIILMIFSLNGFGQTQNLVPNSGFESVNTCNVNGFAQVFQSINDWYYPPSDFMTPDFFNYCYSDSDYIPPNTYAGNSIPFNGDAMAGIGFGPYWFTDYRENLSVDFLSTMVQGTAYKISFWYKNSKNSDYTYSTNMLNVAISSDTFRLNQVKLNNNLFQDFSDSTSGEWQRFETYYLSSGGETTLTIGFMGDHDFSHETNPVDDLLYYFLDDVEVVSFEASPSIQIPNIITANGDMINDQLTISHEYITSMEVAIFNRWGNQVIAYNGLSESWNGLDESGKEVSEGVYFVKVRAESLFKNELMLHQYVTLVR